MKNITSKLVNFEKKDGKILKKQIIVSEINKDEIQLRINDSKTRIESLTKEIEDEKNNISELEKLSNCTV